MEWLLVIVSTILAVEVFLHTKIKQNVDAMLDFMKRSASTIKSVRISDHWKEKVIAHYALKIFINSFQLLFSLMLVIAPIFALHYFGSIFSIDLFTVLVTPVGFFFSIGVASVYIFLRIKLFHVRL